jgi:hypothetical protein
MNTFMKLGWFVIGGVTSIFLTFYMVQLGLDVISTAKTMSASL